MRGAVVNFLHGRDIGTGSMRGLVCMLLGNMDVKGMTGFTRESRREPNDEDVARIERWFQAFEAIARPQ